MKIIYIFILISICLLKNTFAGDISGGFVFPEAERLGKGNHKLDIVNMLFFGTLYSYGLTDYLEFKMGHVGVVTGNIGLKFHFPKLLNAHEISVDTRFLIGPHLDDRYEHSASSTPGVSSILSYSFVKWNPRMTFNIGYASFLDEGDLFAIDLIFNMKIGEKVNFIGEVGWIFVEEDLQIFGITFGPRKRWDTLTLDFGLIYSSLIRNSKSDFIFLPLINLHFLF